MNDVLEWLQEWGLDQDPTWPLLRSVVMVRGVKRTGVAILPGDITPEEMELFFVLRDVPDIPVLFSPCGHVLSSHPAVVMETGEGMQQLLSGAETVLLTGDCPACRAEWEAERAAQEQQRR